jgi:hypothetical protein
MRAIIDDLGRKLRKQERELKRVAKARADKRGTPELWGQKRYAAMQKVKALSVAIAVLRGVEMR